MTSIENLVLMCRNYLLSIGSEPVNVDGILNNKNFNRGLIIKLSDSNVIIGNKSIDHTGKQTHIHITGDLMEFFYESSFLNRIRGNTEDENIRIEIISSNIEHLNEVLVFKKNREKPSYFMVSGKTSLLISNTVKKIGHGGTQVQLSKSRQDGEAFKRLRNGLFLNDILVFLEYNNSERGYLVIGLPSFYIENHNLVYRESALFNSNQQSIVNSEFRIRLSSVTAKDIATYNRAKMDEDGNPNRNGIDLSNAILTRGERTERHQAILKVLASYLEKNRFSIYEGNIDCLAVRENIDTLIFEAKTLDGTATDEAKQVRFALGQLIYYEFFATQQFIDTDKLKIAYFESEIADVHIDLLRQNGCMVIWLNEQGEFSGDTESIEFMESLNNH